MAKKVLFTGFGELPCPMCRQETLMRLDLDDLNFCSCSDCQNRFTLNKMKNTIDKWKPVFDWIDQAPKLRT